MRSIKDFYDFEIPTFGSISSFFDRNWTTDEEGNTVFEIDVPGFNKDNLKVEVEGGVMTIQGQTDRRQIYKRYTIGDIEDIKASLTDGILSLTLITPKKKVKKIELKQIEHKEEEGVAVS